MGEANCVFPHLPNSAFFHLPEGQMMALCGANVALVRQRPSGWSVSEALVLPFLSHALNHGQTFWNILTEFYNLQSPPFFYCNNCHSHSKTESERRHQAERSLSRSAASSHMIHKSMAQPLREVHVFPGETPPSCPHLQLHCPQSCQSL